MFDNLNACINELITVSTVNNISVKVGEADTVLKEVYISKNAQINANTKFDMASITKIISTTSLTLIAIDKGLLNTDDLISKYFMCPEDKKNLRIFHLLTHTIGYGHRFFGDKKDIEKSILDVPCEIPIGTDVMYSCPAFILLGKILEKVFGMPLYKAFTEYVSKPLLLNDTSFNPKNGVFVNSNISDSEAGIVNDKNARLLDGVSGNAGLFSTVNDLTKYTQMLLNDGQPIISKEVFTQAVKNHTLGMCESRGLGFLYVDERYEQTGGLFSTGSFGHCGHTGQSLFVDPISKLYVIILSDATVSTVKKYGKEDYNEVKEMRRKIHKAIKEDIHE